MTIDERVTVLEAEAAEQRAEIRRHKQEREQENFGLLQNFELLKAWVDSRFSPSAPPEAPPPAAVAVTEPPAIVAPPDNAELWEAFAELVDINLKALATGKLDTERAARLKDRVLARRKLITTS
jgi:hypothetical protein